MRPPLGKREIQAAWMAVAVVCLALDPSAVAHSVRGTVPPDWPSGLEMPVEAPIVIRPSFAGAPGRSAPTVVQVRIGDRQPTTRPAEITPATPAEAAPPAMLRLILNLKESDRGQPIEIRLVDMPHGTAAPAYKTSYKEPFLHVTTPNDKPILTYWHGQPDHRNAKGYPLNDFIHPLTGLDGETLTTASPRDHVHHRGIFWAWVRTERQGRWKNEWWMPRDFLAEPDLLHYDPAGTVSCAFEAEHFWVYRPPPPASAERFLREVVNCRIYATTDAGRAVDVDLSLTALTDGIRLGGQTDLDKGYGGMTCRFGSATEVRMENDAGLIQSTSLNHLVAKWVDWTGLFVGPDGKRLAHRSGAALMVHPSHPNYPPEWIVRAYGPIGLAYPGLQMIELPQGRPLLLRYRFWIHRGGAADGRVPEAYRAYCADWRWTPG